ncbi:glycerol dehydratase reactivase beta/small subunit family protein [Mycolicibacterium palauense]|uniref:glycerol dehydratase reactivase beta/small subunit family protein n=1 Tax=Mycolicibacterium palauense TaxID=2034511 RepID=UPI000BFEE750|nr:glycerol dehydratase reactivase beta/small subunit family protein [Mycolicibacterium palauense]
MLEGGQPEKPAIYVLSASPGPVEREVLAGIEEECVPYVLSRLVDIVFPEAGADLLAREAARLSSLDVGVGIDLHDRVSVRHELLSGAIRDPMQDPMQGLACDGAADRSAARDAGHNAARLVVGVPLRLRGLRGLEGLEGLEGLAGLEGLEGPRSGPPAGARRPPPQGSVHRKLG